MALTVGSLFSGIGGIDLGLERAGMVTRWFVEIDRFARAVLAKHWPDRPIYGDIREVDWQTVEPVDILVGGFPCQPVSDAGRRLAQDDERWLWPEFARAIRALRPRYVLVENVAALLGRGFSEVITDLATLGYDTEWDCIPAYTVGAPHERDRIWIVAYAQVERPPARSSQPSGGSATPQPERPDDHFVADAPRIGGRRRSRQVGQRPDAPGRGAAMADADGQGRGRRGRRGSGHARHAPAVPDQRGPVADAVVSRSTRPEPREGRTGFPTIGSGGIRLTESRVVRAPDGIPAWLDGHRWPAPPGPQHEWEPPRTVRRGTVPNRTRRVGTLGNAVVPQLVEWIGRRIVAFDEARAMNEMPERAESWLTR